MTIVPDQIELENLLKDIPQFQATITFTLTSLDAPLVSMLSFKYDDTNIFGGYSLPNLYGKLLAEESGVEDFWQLKDKKIIVYIPSIESGKIYAIKPAPLVNGMSSEQKLLYESMLAEFKEKFKVTLK